MPNRTKAKKENLEKRKRDYDALPSDKKGDGHRMARKRPGSNKK